MSCISLHVSCWHIQPCSVCLNLAWLHSVGLVFEQVKKNNDDLKWPPKWKCCSTIHFLYFFIWNTITSVGKHIDQNTVAWYTHAVNIQLNTWGGKLSKKGQGSNSTELFSLISIIIYGETLQDVIRQTIIWTRKIFHYVCNAKFWAKGLLGVLKSNIAL